MIELEKQIHETELEQQAQAAVANKQRIDLMDKIRVVMKINVCKVDIMVPCKQALLDTNFLESLLAG